MALGYGGHADWRDMSEYLVHLTEKSSLSSILRSLRIEARSPRGAIYNHASMRDSQLAVSLSEIPVDRLARLAARHGSFGIAFERKTVIPKGANPVWYLEKGSPLQAKVFETIRRAAYVSVPDPDLLMWRMTPFIEYPGDYRDNPYRFEWEREWRVHGDLDFGLRDVAFLFGPEAKHARLATLWSDLSGGLSSPPLLDANWTLERLQTAAQAGDL